MDDTPKIKIKDVLSAAKEAGAAIMGHLQQGIQVENKSDDSPVTEADKAADAIIKTRLRAIAPGIPIVSEEDNPAERHAAVASRVKWVVDPLDGTKTAIDYANGQKTYDQFGVHIALVKDNVPVLGVAYFPAMAGGTAYFTGDDGKAYKQTADDVPRRIQVSRPPFKEGELRAAVHFHLNRRPETIAGRPYRAVPGVGGQRLCMVAEGTADVADMDDITRNSDGHSAYMQWDLDAGQAILKAAGGELVSVKTKEPILSDSADFAMPAAYAGGVETLKLLGLAHPSLSKSGLRL